MGQQQSRAGSFISSPSSRPEHGLSVLHIEVLKLKHLGRSSYHGMDYLKRACRRAAGRPWVLNPYVEVSVGRGRCWTNTLEAEEGGDADFGCQSLHFMLERQHAVSFTSSLHCDPGDREVVVKVFDRRHMGNVIRGHPLLGEARLQLGYLEICGRKRKVALEIRRRGKIRGELILCYSVRPASDAYSVLASPSQHRLPEVADALAQVLSGPEGLEILFDALPDELVPPGGREKAHDVMQKLLVSLCNQVGMLTEESDAEVFDRFARLSHSIQAFVSSCCGAQDAAQGAAATACAFAAGAAQARFESAADAAAGAPSPPSAAAGRGADAEGGLLAAPPRERLPPSAASVGRSEGATGGCGGGGGGRGVAAVGPEARVALLTEQWIRTIFSACVQRSEMLGGVMPRLRDDRLQRFLEAGRQFPGVEDLVPIDSTGREALGLRGGWSLADDVPRASILGKGAQGQVWRAKDRRTCCWYAVKSSWQRHSPADKRERELVDHILMCPHPCIVQLYGAYYFDELHQSTIVMEFCPGGDLFEKIRQLARSAEYSPPAQALQWFGQIFLALEHLHLKLKTLLRDLKLQNVVLTQQGRAKLTDFGHGRIGANASGHFTLHFGPPGSPHFVAPEVVRRKPYDWKVDLYSFGVLVWVVLTGGLLETPALPPCHETHDWDFEALAANWSLLEQCIRDPAGNGARPLPSPESRSFVRALTQESMSSRPNHEKIRSHRFMQPLGLPPTGSKTEVLDRWLRSGQRPQSDLHTSFGAEASESLLGVSSQSTASDLDRARLTGLLRTGYGV